jgi:hypothetical protein
LHLVLVREERPLLPNELARLIGRQPRTDRLLVGRDGQGFGGLDRLVQRARLVELAERRMLTLSPTSPPSG